MRLFITAIGVTLVFGAFSLVGIGQVGSSAPGTVDRVEIFERLPGPRIAVSENAQGVAPLREFCPDTTETCRNYWAYTGHFVRNYTVPLRDKELLILRTAWLSRGDYVWGRHNIMGHGML